MDLHNKQLPKPGRIGRVLLPILDSTRRALLILLAPALIVTIWVGASLHWVTGLIVVAALGAIFLLVVAASDWLKILGL